MLSQFREIGSKGKPCISPVHVKIANNSPQNGASTMSGKPIIDLADPHVFLDLSRFVGSIHPGSRSDFLLWDPGNLFGPFRGIALDMRRQSIKAIGPLLHKVPVIETFF